MLGTEDDSVDGPTAYEMLFANQRATEKSDVPRKAVQQRYELDVLSSTHYHEFVATHPPGTPPPMMLGTPLRSLHPEDWNTYFEWVYEEKYGPTGDSAAYRAKALRMLELGYQGNKPLCDRDWHASCTKLSLFQLGMAERVREMLNAGAFVRHWEALGREEKRKLALAGLLRGADVATEQGRFDCPEMSLLGLIGERAGEKDLIALYKDIATHDEDTAGGPVHFFRDAKFEAEMTASMGPEGYWQYAYGQVRIMNRLLFISATLNAILDIYEGIPPDPRWTKDIPRVWQGCFSCGLKTDSMMRCTGCIYALYCSPRCQKQHWKEHKPYCNLLKGKFVRPIEGRDFALAGGPLPMEDTPSETSVPFAEALKVEREMLQWH